MGAAFGLQTGWRERECRTGGTVEVVNRASTAVPADVARRADKHGVAAENNGGAIVGREFLLLRPGCTATCEDISRALIHDCADVVLHCTHNRCVAVERDRDAEEIASRAVTGREFLLLWPDCAVAHKLAEKHITFAQIFFAGRMTRAWRSCTLRQGPILSRRPSSRLASTLKRLPERPRACFFKALEYTSLQPTTGNCSFADNVSFEGRK